MAGRRIRLLRIVVMAGAALVVAAAVATAVGCGGAGGAGAGREGVGSNPPPSGPGPRVGSARAVARAIQSYMISYGALDAQAIATAKTYPLVILHPERADLTRALVADIHAGVDAGDPADDVLVLCYVSVGEDLRTAGLDDAALAADPRFRGDGSGPRVDPRGPDADGQPLAGVDPRGRPSDGGGGLASFYLDDNSVDRDGRGDGLPDRNRVFGAAFVNAGDPAWFPVIDGMTLDGPDGVPGLAEVLTTKHGRGLGCDGIFLDTIDTAAPNDFTDAASPNQSEFEWTAPGFTAFIERVRRAYPDRIILQNRGLFFFDPRHPHYAFTTGGLVDLVMFESYRLDSNPADEANAYHYADNRHNLAPKLMAEAGRGQGFRVLSLGYAAGPPGTMATDTLIGRSILGFESLLEDIHVAQDLAGFRHYITDREVTLVNTFVRDHAGGDDVEPPAWSSTFNDREWGDAGGGADAVPGEPSPRVGVQEAVPGPKRGSLTVRWDVALDRSGVEYTLYLATEPFDFAADPGLEGARRVALEPQVGQGYQAGVGAGVFPYQATVEGLAPGKDHHLLIRARDRSPAANEDGNQAVVIARPRP